jgi:hypothetical protein
MQKIARPLLEECRDESARETEAEADKPQRITDERRRRWREVSRYRCLEGGPICSGCELLRDLGQESLSGVARVRF